VGTGLVLFSAASALSASKAPDWVVRAGNTEMPPRLLQTQPTPDAAVLWKQQIVTAGSITGSTKLFQREAVKILTAQGVSAGIFRSSYDDDSKVDVEGAWTVHTDGSAEVLSTREVVSVQLANAEFFTDTYLMAFQPPRLSAGDIAAFALSRKSRRDVYQWVLPLQGEEPIVAQEVVVDLPEGWTHRWRLTAAPEEYSGPLTGEGGAKASYPFAPQRAIPREELSLPKADLTASLEVTILPPTGKFPQFVFRSWDDVASWFYRKSLPARAQAPTNLVAWTAGTGALREASRWVQDKVRYVAVEVGQGGYVPREPALVAKRLYGDCKDKSFLLMSLLAQKGIEALPVLTRSRDHGRIDPDFPSPANFRHLIVAVKIGESAGLPAEVRLREGVAVLFDPTDAWTPYGKLPQALQGARGLLVRPEGGELVEFPFAPARLNRLERTVDAEIGEDGSLKARVALITDGALSQRAAYQHWTPVEREDALRRSAAEHIWGSHASGLELVNLDDREKPMEARFSVSSEGYLRKTGTLLLLPVLPFPVGPARLQRLEERRSPVNLDSSQVRELTVRFRLPAGLRVDALPDPVQVENRYIRYRFAVSQKEGRIVATESYEVEASVIPLTDFAAWRDVEAAAAKAASAKAVIVRGG
jgi:hypothetical protein